MTFTEGEDGYIIAEYPALPGCLTQGRTREEALANIKKAIALSIETRRERGPPGYEIAEAEVADELITLPGRR